MGPTTAWGARCTTTSRGTASSRSCTERPWSPFDQARQERAAEFATLQRFQLEAEEAVAYWRMEVRQQARHNENRRVFLEVLDDGAMSPEQRPAVDDAIQRLGHYPQFNPPRSVYEELVAAGGLSRISDPAVRNAIGAYAAELDFVMGQLTQFRTGLPELYDAYEGRIFSAYDPQSRSLPRYGTTSGNSPTIPCS